MTPLTLFHNSFISRSSGVVSFADIMKIAIILIKTIYKDSIIVKRITKKYRNAIFYAFLDIAKTAKF